MNGGECGCLPHVAAGAYHGSSPIETFCGHWELSQLQRNLLSANLRDLLKKEPDHPIRPYVLQPLGIFLTGAAIQKLTPSDMLTLPCMSLSQALVCMQHK